MLSIEALLLNDSLNRVRMLFRNNDFLGIVIFKGIEDRSSGFGTYPFFTVRFLRHTQHARLILTKLLAGIQPVNCNLFFQILEEYAQPEPLTASSTGFEDKDISNLELASTSDCFRRLSFVYREVLLLVASTLGSQSSSDSSSEQCIRSKEPR
jgi:hypothetical protein